MKIDKSITLKKLFNMALISSITLLIYACEPDNSESIDPPILPPRVESYDFEIIPEDEAGKIAEIARKTMRLQEKRAVVFSDQQNGKKLRGVHPKSHGCVTGELEINQDIDPSLQVGLFSNPGKRYKTLIRYSNASVRLADDLENGSNGSRGMAIKVFDVGGNLLDITQGRQDQDFLMINTSAFAFPNVQSYKRLTDALADSPSGADPSAAFSEVPDWTHEDRKNFAKTFAMLGKIRSKAVRNPLEVQYFAAAPSAFGRDRVMKFSVEPCGGEIIQEAFDDQSDASPDYLHEALVATMSQAEKVCLDLKIQVIDSDQVKADRASDNGLGDLIEDATREWSDQDYPFVKVARITLDAPQTIALSDPIQLDCKAQSFNPWHALVEHQPLGGINRLRRPVYLNSAVNRP